MKALVWFGCGLLFGLGLWVSGMAQPAKVIGFLDVFGRWDPSLALVMLSAIVTTTIGYRRVLARPAPWLAERFQLPSASPIDARLLGGAALFGLGWGLSGYCPGPALTGLSVAGSGGLAFIAAMLAGVALVRTIDMRGSASTAKEASA